MTHKIGTRKQWLDARIELLKAEKELTRRSDELARQRQALPWVRIDKEYQFETDAGAATLKDLFRGRSQLLIYHFMFGPDFKAGCPSCSMIADGFEGFAVHLANHDVALSAVSRAPLAKLQAYKRRMGWTFPWASSNSSDFNFDFKIAFTEEQQRAGNIEYNYERDGHAMDATTEVPRVSRQVRGRQRHRLAHLHARPPGHERVRDGRRRCLSHVLHLRARTRWPVGRVPVAGSRAAGTQRVRYLVEAPRRVHRGVSTLISHHGLLRVSAVLFAASAVTTVIWCGSMSAMPGMEMPGGWTMSMTWMRMPGQSWPGAAATFLGMWIVMMIAMMLPVLAPMLLRYQRTVSAAGATRLARLTTIVGVAYFLVWTAFGVAVYPAGVALAEAAMARPSLARATPVTIGLVVMIAGLLQFTSWKARQLACCRANPVLGLRPDSSTAFRHGLQLGIRCIRCCLGPTAILLCLGVMDLRAMAIVTAAIALERLSPANLGLARLTGAFATSAGLWLIVLAVS